MFQHVNIVTVSFHCFSSTCVPAFCLSVTFCQLVNHKYPSHKWLQCNRCVDICSPFSSPSHQISVKRDGPSHLIKIHKGFLCALLTFWSKKGLRAAKDCPRWQQLDIHGAHRKSFRLQKTFGKTLLGWRFSEAQSCVLPWRQTACTFISVCAYMRLYHYLDRMLTHTHS